MQYVLTPKQMQALDAHMIEAQGIPGLVLMEHAAAGVVEAALRLLPENGGVLALCGGGNNGGDGLSVLRQLHMRGIRARGVLLVEEASLAGDAKKQYAMATASGVPVTFACDDAAVGALSFSGVHLIIDALFGTGLNRDAAGHFLAAIRRINASALPVIAVDIPSGIDGYTGKVLGDAVRAQETVTFQHKKRGHILMPGREYTGTLTVVPIGIPSVIPDGAATMLDESDMARLLPPRPLSSHKGKNGRALLFAGSTNYTGAAILCARSALRAGTGLLHAAVPGACAGAVVAACPAAIVHPIGAMGEWPSPAMDALSSLMEAADAVALGPGMGQGEGVPIIAAAALRTKKPAVIDADGLNALAAHPELMELLHENAVLTPHPGEMARLMGGPSAAEIAADPARYSREFTQAHRAVVLLKGTTSVIAQGARCCLNATGNPGLAKGGSGDVLTGVILALLAQGLTPYDAACLGAYLLGISADAAMRRLETRMLLPTDVIDAMEALL